MNTGSGRPRPRKGDHILLVDRCQMDGLHGIPLRDHYGDITAQALEDITFLTEAGRRGWGVLTQNPRMWQVPQERACIIENHVRVVSLDDPNASKTLKGIVLGRHLLSIRRRLRRPDPCFWRLRLLGVRKELA